MWVALAIINFYRTAGFFTLFSFQLYEYEAYPSMCASRVHATLSHPLLLLLLPLPLLLHLHLILLLRVVSCPRKAYMSLSLSN
jgi:hypothetical protein